MADGRRRWPGIAALALLAAAAWCWLANPAGHDDASGLVAVPAATPDAPAPPVPVAPLPPVDAPLPSFAHALASRADTGDSRAACRLALELLRCEALEDEERRQPGAEGYRAREDALVASGNLEAANRVAELELWRKERLAECRALPPELHGQRWDRLRTAALAGEADAMRRYIDAHALLGADHDMIRHPRFDAWRREAPRMLEELFRQGDGWALMRLWFGSINDDSQMTGLVPDDHARARAYELLAYRLSARGREEPVRVRLVPASAEEVAAAERQARSWEEQYFSGRRLDAGSSGLPSLAWPLQGGGLGCD